MNTERIVSSNSISLRDLESHVGAWLLTCEIDQHSPRTISNRKSIVDKLVWFMRTYEYPEADLDTLRRFLAYVTNGHKKTGGRWGNPQCIRPVRPRTVHTYHGHLRTFFRWCISEELITTSPMERIPIPISRSDQVQPFSREQVDALLAAAGRTQQSRRDKAILWTMLDTGLRASELCTLRRKDCEFTSRRLVVLGKGNKHRTLPFGKVAARALWEHMRYLPIDPNGPLFPSERHGDFMTRNGLRLLFGRLGHAAGIHGIRCSPHTCRHTFAIEYLRAGGNAFGLQTLLGHTSMAMTQKYVAIAQADVERAHLTCSPADRMHRRDDR